MLLINTPLSKLDSPDVAVDLNTLVEQGEYTGLGVTMTNAPATDSSTIFKLLVSVDPSTGDVTQFIIDAAGTASRTYTKATTTWGAWA